MSNRYKGYQKVADHQNYGFTAKQAMYEHNQEKTQGINRSIVTKTGLPTYTDKQCQELSGECTTTSLIPERMTWFRFKRINRDEQKAYLDSIFDRYPSLKLVTLAEMFDGDSTTVSGYLHRNFGDRYGSRKRAPYNSEDEKRFRKEMMKGMLPLGERTTNQVEEITDIVTNLVVPVKEEPKLVMGGIVSANLRCDANELPSLIKQLGMVGLVHVYIQSEEKEDDSNGLKQIV